MFLDCTIISSGKVSFALLPKAPYKQTMLSCKIIISQFSIANTKESYYAFLNFKIQSWIILYHRLLKMGDQN